MDSDGTLVQRLLQRKLVQWTAAYVASAAALFGTLQGIGEVFAWPAGLMRAVFYLLLAGLVATVVIAWFHGEKGRQRVSTVEVLLLCATALLGVAGAAHSLRAASADGGREAAAHLIVLPFTNASGLAEQQYLGDGIAEELRQRLGTLADVRIRRGATAGGGAPVTRGSITHVLDGTVQRAGTMLHITARLIDDAGSVIWSDRYDVPTEALLDVEDRIAAGVARVLRPEDARAHTAAARRRTADPVAHDHYLRGEHALKQRTPASVIQAISEYREASAIDPDMTAAIAREAYGYALFLDWGWTYPGLDAAALMRRGTELSDRAVQQDSLSPEAWLARAYMLMLRDPERLRGAPEAFGRAVALDPTNPEAQHQYGQTLMVLGRYAEAKAAYHAALAVEADRPLTVVPLSAIALREGDIRSAQRWSDSAVALAPNAPYPWTSRAQLRLVLGDAAGARADAEQALRIDPSYALPARSALAAALTRLGQQADAEQALTQARAALVQPARPSSTEGYYLAAALLLMGRPAESLDVLAAARPRGAWLWFYFQSPIFDPIRNEPRFQQIIAEADPRTS